MRGDQAPQPAGTDGGHPRTFGRAAVLALAGAAFAIGAVASLELLSLALPGPRGTFRTWGPVATALAAALILVIGVPGALVAETATLRATDRAALTVTIYLLVAVLSGLGLWLAWRAFVVPDASPIDLVREFVMLGVGALAIWGGARMAERASPTPLFAFGGAAVAAVIVATAVMLT